MSMTREELRSGLLEIIGTASTLFLNDEGTRLDGVFNDKLGLELGDAALALFDRFEREQWSEPGEQPAGEFPRDSRWVLVAASGLRWLDLVPVMTWDSHWRFRELPPGPRGE